MANVKNYKEQGGEKLVIEGEIEIKGTMTVDQNATVTGLNAAPLPTASATTLGGVKVGAGLAIDDGVLSTPAATQSTIGAVMVGEGLDMDSGTGMISVHKIGGQAPSVATTVEDLVSDFNELLSKMQAAEHMANYDPGE